MNTPFKITCLFSITIVMLATGCLVRETVTVNGDVKEQDLKFKRPIKQAIQNSDIP